LTLGGEPSGVGADGREGPKEPNGNAGSNGGPAAGQRSTADGAGG
jgi:hypothetical protein